MAVWTNLLDAVIGHKKPITLQQGRALRDNPIAMAEGAAGAPFLRHWRPYDALAVGDGATGVIYDHATDGTVASVTSPDFEAGWDYRFVVEDLTPSISGDSYLALQLYGATEGGWSGLQQISETALTDYPLYGSLDLGDPAAIKRNVSVASTVRYGSGDDIWFDRAPYWGLHRYSTAQARPKALLKFASGAFTVSLVGGTIRLYRQPVYGTASW